MGGPPPRIRPGVHAGAAGKAAASGSPLQRAFPAAGPPMGGPPPRTRPGVYAGAAGKAAASGSPLQPAFPAAGPPMGGPPPRTRPGVYAGAAAPLPVLKHWSNPGRGRHGGPAGTKAAEAACAKEHTRGVPNGAGVARCTRGGSTERVKRAFAWAAWGVPAGPAKAAVPPCCRRAARLRFRRGRMRTGRPQTGRRRTDGRQPANPHAAGKGTLTGGGRKNRLQVVPP